MICINCGKYISDNLKTCPKCGVTILDSTTIASSGNTTELPAFVTNATGKIKFKKKPLNKTAFAESLKVEAKPVQPKITKKIELKPVLKKEKDIPKPPAPIPLPTKTVETKPTALKEPVKSLEPIKDYTPEQVKAILEKPVDATPRKIPQPETTENIRNSVEPGTIADPILRVKAFIIDFAILFTGLLLFSLIIGIRFENRFYILLAAVFVPILYFSFLESGEKQGSIGKNKMKIKVVDMKFNRITFQQALYRNIIKYLFSSMFGVGFFMAFLTRKKQTLHDMIVDTIVVYV